MEDLQSTVAQVSKAQAEKQQRLEENILQIMQLQNNTAISASVLGDT